MKNIILIFAMLLTLTVGAQNKKAMFDSLASYRVNGDVDKFLKTAEMLEKLTLTGKESICLYRSLSFYNTNIKNWNSALYYANKVLSYPKNPEQVSAYSTLSYAASEVEKDTLKAEMFLLKGLGLAKSFDDTMNITAQYCDLLKLFITNQEKLNKYALEALPYGEKNTMLNGNLGIYFTLKGDYNKALYYYNLTLKEEQGPLNVCATYECIADVYERKGDYKSSHEYLYKAYDVRTEYFEKLTNKTTREFNSKFELTTKQKDIEILNQQNNFKTKQITISLISTVITIILLIVILISYKKVRKQRELVQQQKEVIEHKNKDINDSINYALGIQQTILPTLPSNCSVFFQPKDVVSGDFYWFKEVENFKYYVVADCTGHGVPGALLSMVCSEIITSTVKEFTSNQNRVDLMLTEINNKVKEKMFSLGRQDGMEMAIIALDNENNVYYSGAKRNLYLVRDNNLVEYSATKHAIGGDTNTNQEFKLIEIKAEIGDNFYMTSDGYVDQFGTNNKKFSTRRFKETITSLNATTSTQNNELKNIFNDWMGQEEQLDDVLVMIVNIK